MATTFRIGSNMPLSIASIPADPASRADAAMLDFGAEAMNASFEAGCAAAAKADFSRALRSAWSRGKRS